MTQRAARFAAAAVVLAGLALTAWTHASVPAPVFYSGDGGLKWLCARQIAETGGAATLDLGGPAWVGELRDAGLYPYRPPFVYRTPDGDLPQYPLPFLYLTAPFVAWLGVHGALLIPALAMFATWVVHARTLTKLEVEGPRALLSNLALILGSPLLFYGSTYWEHAPATFLVHLAICRTLTAGRGGGAPGAAWAATTGALFGLAFWLRPEAGAAACLFAALAFVSPLLPASAPRLAFAAGAGAAIAGFLVWNRIVHGMWLGVHGRNLDGTMTAAARFSLVAKHGPLELSHLLWVLPVAPVAWAAPLVRLLRRDRSAPDWTGPLALWTVLAVAAAAVITPSTPGREWGPRFFLHVVPALCLLLPWTLPAGRGAVPRLVAGGVAALVLCGVAMNSAVGLRGLRTDYRERVWPAMRAVLAHESPVVVAAVDTVPLEMAGAADRKWFLLTGNDGEIARAARGLRAQGIRSFPFVSQDNRPHPRAREFEVRGEGVVVRLRQTMRTPQFLVYEATVE